jgi:hypothetical protein
MENFSEMMPVNFGSGVSMRRAKASFKIPIQ